MSNPLISLTGVGLSLLTLFLRWRFPTTAPWIATPGIVLAGCLILWPFVGFVRPQAYWAAAMGLALIAFGVEWQLAHPKPISQEHVETPDRRPPEPLPGRTMTADLKFDDIQMGSRPRTSADDPPSLQDKADTSASDNLLAEQLRIQNEREAARDAAAAEQRELTRRQALVVSLAHRWVQEKGDGIPDTDGAIYDAATEFINRQLEARGEAWRLDAASRRQLGLPD